MKKLFALLLFISAAYISPAQQVKISALPAANAPLSGTEILPIVQSGTSKKATIANISGLSLDSCKRSHDSVFCKKNNAWAFQYIDSVGSGGTGNGLSFKLSTTQPTDTTVVWVNTNYNILNAYPIQFRINGKWSALDTLSGLFYDNVAGIVSNGRPFTVIVSGQSNFGGCYCQVPSAWPYNYYYGDTVTDAHVTGWNDSTLSWEKGKYGSRNTPWQYASGASATMIFAKKYALEHGRSVRVVMDIQGGIGLQRWSGSIHGIPDTAAGFLSLKAKVQRAGISHPDLMLWGHGESGIDSAMVDPNITYYDKLIQFYGALRRFHVVDSAKTVIIAIGTGDTAYKNTSAPGIGLGEGGARATQFDKDPLTGCVSTQYAESDGLHFTAKGHEYIGNALYAAYPTFPLNPLTNPSGVKDTSMASGVNEPRTLVMAAIRYTASDGRAFFDLKREPSYGDPYANASNQYGAGLYFNNITTNSVNLQHYNALTILSLENARFLFRNRFVEIQQAVGGLVIGPGSLDGFDPGGAPAMYINLSKTAQLHELTVSPKGISIMRGGAIASAALHLPAVNATAGTAPLKFSLTSPTLLITPEAGVMEAIGDSALHYTGGDGVRRRLAYASELPAASTPTGPATLIQVISVGGPSVDVKEEPINSFGITFTWTYVATGIYDLVADSGTPFASDRTRVTFNLDPNDNDDYTGFARVQGDRFTIRFYTKKGGVATDDALIRGNIKIEVDP